MCIPDARATSQHAASRQRSSGILRSRYGTSSCSLQKFRACVRVNAGLRRLRIIPRLSCIILMEVNLPIRFCVYYSELFCSEYHQRRTLMNKLDSLVQGFLAQKKVAIVGVSDKRETGCNDNYKKFKENGYQV